MLALYPGRCQRDKCSDHNKHRSVNSYLVIHAFHNEQKCSAYEGCAANPVDHDVLLTSCASAGIYPYAIAQHKVFLL